MPILPAFDADAFVPGAPIDNPYYPLLPGQVRAYRAEAVDDESGEVEVETHNTFVTFETIDIQGVQATVVRDTEYLNGQLTEDTLDYYAQDQDGNVWYLGEDVINYRYDDDGAFIGTDDDGAFRAGVDGAQGGWKMQAEPGFGAGYYQEFDPGNAIDEGIVIGVGETAEIELGTFEDAIKILDTTALDPDAAEFKFYAPGVGEVLVEEDIDETGEGELIVELQELREVGLIDDEGEVRESLLEVDADDEGEDDDDVGDEVEDDACDDEDVTDGDDDGEEVEVQLKDIEDGKAVAGLDDAGEPELDDFLGDGGDITVSFLGENGAFDSVLGAYTVDLETGALGEGRILFASTEEAEAGQSVAVTVDEGEALGLFLVPDGADSGLDFDAFMDGGLFFENVMTRETATIDDLLAPLVTNAEGDPLPVIGLHALGNEDGLNFLNPAAGLNAIELESVLTDLPDGDEITIVGFEDMLVTDAHNDGDFNDVVVAVSSEALGGDALAGLVGELNSEAAIA